MVLRIYAVQMDEFEKSELQKFVGRMVIHLNKFFPEQCEALGAEQVEEAILLGVDKAKSYDIRSERNVCKFIDLMFSLGRDFDTNDELPWAYETLNDYDLQNDPDGKINLLFDRAMIYVNSKAEQK